MQAREDDDDDNDEQSNTETKNPIIIQWHCGGVFI